ncbi:hypothetical protein ISS40_01055 [Candidatus Bathyarchaeota archaeon]|nr:hypothetical protein [Candidatus Bathyarchaeota archaeon]
MRNLRRRVGKHRQEEALEKSVTKSRKILPSDPVRFCVEWLGYEPFEYMWPFLRDRGHFVANVQARQTGKTFNGMAKLLYLAFRYPGSLILVTAPKYDQVKNIAFKALAEHLKRLQTGDPAFFRYAVGERNVLRTVIRFRNGSQILAESPIPETIRGHTAKVIYLMECNFIREDEDLYTSVLFTLNTTNGYLYAESTPWNTDSVFYKMFHDPAYDQFSRHRVLYTEAMPPQGPLSPEVVEMIEKQLAGDPARWKREMLCEWTEDLNVWLPTSLITLAQDSALDYLDYDVGPRGEFYLGADFGKHVDYSVVAVVERLHGHLYLRHLHRFPLETSYGAVIGYMKRLQDRWRTVNAVYADKTGVGDYIVEDMERGGLRNVTGVNFTDQSKEAMATCLKEKMRSAVCPSCGWRGYVDGEEEAWMTVCPEGCFNEEGNRVGLRPLLHIPFDPDLFHELNLERYELSKSGKLLFNHPQGTNDDRFWSLALAVYAADQVPPPSKPIARTI